MYRLHFALEGRGVNSVGSSGIGVYGFSSKNKSWNLTNFYCYIDIISLAIYTDKEV